MGIQHFNKLICVIACIVLLVYYNQSNILDQMYQNVLQTRSTHKQDEYTPVSGVTNIKNDTSKIFAAVLIEELLKGPYILTHDNLQLIEYIQYKLSPPSKEPYQLTNANLIDPSRGQTKEIINILGEMRNGFFVECGAWDGESISNTLMFERKYGWNGVMVEANSKHYNQLMSKKRKAWTIHACLSRKPYPNTVMFPVKAKSNIRMSNKSVFSKQKRYTEVQCLPLFSILLALNTTTIDFFSLDIEGHELDVLNTIPWERVNIRTLSVEHKHIPGGNTALCQYMETVGYYIYKPINPILDAKEKDTIFYKKDILPKIKGL